MQTAEPTVLIVDNEEVFRYALAEMFRSIDPRHRVEQASDGVAALSCIGDPKPDAIVLDLQMPRLDGFAALNRLSNDPSTRDIPVLISISLPNVEAARTRPLTARAFLSREDLSRETVRTALISVLGERH
jgi:CheY-like chemotaxis protein